MTVHWGAMVIAAFVGVFPVFCYWLGYQRGMKAVDKIYREHYGGGD